jgi:hypothetical protein
MAGNGAVAGAGVGAGLGGAAGSKKIFIIIQKLGALCARDR